MRKELLAQANPNEEEIGQWARDSVMHTDLVMGCFCLYYVCFNHSK